MKKEYAEEVAAKIIEQLQQGTAPWQKPWKPGELSLPRNAITGNEYRGINSMWLAMQGHGDPRWMTYNQANDAGAQVRKGSKGTKIVYWKTHEEEKAKDSNGKPILGPDGKPNMIRVALERPRSFHAVVFNAEQIDGLPPLEPKTVAPEPERHARAEAILANSGATIRHIAGNRAFYSPGTDGITLPERGQFDTADGYYAAALHELGHWTGHSSRLDRDLSNPFGSEGYAREELRAEISSLMVGERLEIGHDPGQHAAYVGAWIKTLQEDPREIFRAAGDAEKIASYVMAFEQEHEQMKDHEQGVGIAQVQENDADNLEAELRATWDKEGVPKEKQDALIAEIIAKAQPGAFVGPFVIPGGDAPAPAVRHQPPEMPVPDRTYLAVPYAEKDQAKAAALAAGIKLQWDKENKAWFAPAGSDLSKMAQWKADSPRVLMPTTKSAEDQFAEALKGAGLIVDGTPVMDGQIHRVSVEGDRAGELSGAYAGHRTGQLPGGYIQNYKSGEVLHWKAEGSIAQTTPEQRAQLAAEAAERRQKREADTGAKHEAAAAAAKALWHEAPAAKANNAYCHAKGITDPVGLRTVPESVPENVAKAHNIMIAATVREAKAMREADPKARVFKTGDLLIPGIDMKDGKLWTLQSVNPDFKSFMKDGRKHGVSTLAGINAEQNITLGTLADQNKPIIVAEGYATANTVAKLADQPVVVAFDSGNLDAVLRELRREFPNRQLLIAADNDHEAETKLGSDGQPRKNVGMEKASAAATAHGAGVIAPPFKPGEKGSDWNDRATDRGYEETRREFNAQMAVAKRDAAINADRLIVLAREREQEVRDDPSTSADDAVVASERGKAAGLIASASEQVGNVRAAAAEGKTASRSGRPAVASVKASLDRKNGELQDDTKRERQDVQNNAQTVNSNGATIATRQGVVIAEQRRIDIADDKQEALAKSKRPRARGIDAGM